MENEKTIEVLNTLLTINKDRIEGYETASNETDKQDLKRLFATFIQTSQKCKQELATELFKLGGEISEGTKNSGKFFRSWMDVKNVYTGNDRKAILTSCEYSEDMTNGTYKRALHNYCEDITFEQYSMICTQHIRIKADHSIVKSLRDSLVKA